MEYGKQTLVNANAPAGRRYKLGPANGSLPIDIWEEIFVRCLPQSDDPNYTVHTAPLLLCRICGDWRKVAISSPNLWTSMGVVVSLGKSRPPVEMVAQWLERSGTLPLTLSLLQINEAEDNRLAAGEVLEIFKKYIHRWQDIRLNVARPECREIGPHQRKAPLLEQLHIRSHRLEEISKQGFFGIFEEVPRLSTLSVSSITSLDYADTSLTIPWNQLTHVSVHFDMSIGVVLQMLSECQNLQIFNLGVEFAPDTLPPLPVTQTTLKTLQIMIAPPDLSVFLRSTTFPALTDIVIYGKDAPDHLLTWPREELNAFLERSETRLLSLGIHNTCIGNTYLTDLLQNPSMRTLMELIIEDNTDWISSACISFAMMDILTFHEQTPRGLLPALQTLKLRGAGLFWPVDSKALVDMVESRWRRYESHEAARLRSLHIPLSLSGFPTCRRLKQLQKEGLHLEIAASFY